jgi:hypothetical protein
MSIEDVLKQAREVIQDYVDEYGPHDKDSGAQYVLNQLDQAIAEAETGPVKVSVFEFMARVEGHEDLRGKPAIWAEWPTKE